MKNIIFLFLFLLSFNVLAGTFYHNSPADAMAMCAAHKVTYGGQCVSATSVPDVYGRCVFVKLSMDWTGSEQYYNGIDFRHFYGAYCSGLALCPDSSYAPLNDVSQCPLPAVCSDGSSAPNNDIAQCPKDCFASYNDLDPIKSGTQCTCVGFLPTSSVSANGVTCDGVKTECPIGSQKIINDVGGITVLSCHDIVVCDPLTDPNQCNGPVVSACITTNQTDPCLDSSSIVDNTVPDFCSVGYYYNKKDKKCYPIKKKETIVDDKTGDTTIITTVNNSTSNSTSTTGDTTTFKNTNDTDTGKESKDEQLPNFVLSASGVFDIATAESSLLTKQSELSDLMVRLKTESTGMFSVSQGVAQLPCYDFTLPFNGGVKKVCFAEHPQVFDILIPLLAFLGYFIAFTIILRN